MEEEKAVLIDKIRAALLDFDARPLSKKDQEAIVKIKRIVVRLKYHNFMPITIVLDSNLT